MKTTKQIESDIDHAQFNSVAYTRIEWLDYSESEAAIAADVLAVQADGSAENGDVTEYWGANDDGAEWRIHVRVTE